MISRLRHQKGYTLIEIMVVIAVLGLIAAVAAASIGQTLNKRYSSEAEKLSIWLNQLADFSIMQGAAFGVLSKPDKKTKKISQLSAVIYYRNQWVEVSFPEPYILGEGADIQWISDDQEKQPLVYQQAALPTKEEIKIGDVRSPEDEEDKFLEPTLAFLPDGYVEPEGSIKLFYKGYKLSYIYYWDSENLRIKMEKLKK
ncbi:MAG: type II secretion system protein [Porticoccaceae bacterium]|nr:type II secretion system protein [Porticoccaceae bacterium]